MFGTTGKKIVLSDLGTGAIVDMLKLLPCRPQQFCGGNECVKKPVQDTVRETRKCVLVRQE